MTTIKPQWANTDTSLDDVLDNIEGTTVTNRYSDIATFWFDLGFTVVPTAHPTPTNPKGKSPAVAFWPYSGDGAPTKEAIRKGLALDLPGHTWTRQVPDSGTLDGWDKHTEHLSYHGLLLLDGHGHDEPSLVVVDVDDLADYQWAIDTFGPTPLQVSTGRAGGGVHLYYRRELEQEYKYRQCMGIDGKGVDVKGWRNYVVAPRSLHQSGVEYQSNIPITLELLESLPVLSWETIEKLRTSTKTTDAKTAPSSSGSRDSKSRAEWIEESAPEWAVLRAYGDGRFDGCPWCESSSYRVTSVSTLGDGRLLARCFKEEVTRIEDRAAKFDDRSRSKLDVSDLVDGKYLPHHDFKPGRSLALRAPKGIGKTEYMAWMVEDIKARDPDAVVVAVAHLRSLVAGLGARLGLDNYEDIKGRIDGSAAICVNSLLRWVTLDLGPDLDGEFGFDSNTEPVPARLDLLVIDELVAVLESIATGKMSGPLAMKVEQKLRLMLTIAKRVIVADADLTPEAVEYVNRFRPDDHLWLVEADKPPDHTYTIIHDEAAWVRQVMMAITDGKTVALASSSKGQVKTMAKRLEKEHPSLKVAAIHSESVGKVDLATINDWVGGFDVLLFSPSMGTGVSVDLTDHFDVVFGFLKNFTLTAASSHQLLHRVRQPKEKDIVVYLQRGGMPLTTSAWAIQRDLLRKQAVTKRKLGRNGLIDPRRILDGVCIDNGELVRDPDALAWNEFYSEQLSHLRKSGVTTLQAAFMGYLRHNGHTFTVVEVTDLTDDEKKAERAAMAEAKEAMEGDWRERVLNADDIGLEEVQRNSTVDPYAKTKAFVRDAYGDVTDDILVFDDRGKGRKRVRAYTHVMTLADGHEDLVLALDADSVRRGDPASHMPHHWAQAEARLVVLKRSGVQDLLGDRKAALGGGGLYTTPPRVALRSDSETEPLTNENLREFATWLDKKRDSLRALGLYVHKDVVEKPVGFLGKVLRDIGLKLEPLGKVYVGKKQVRAYGVNLESVATMEQLSSHYSYQLRSGVLSDELVIDMSYLDDVQAWFEELMDDV